jgi:hypothetical protein
MEKLFEDIPFINQGAFLSRVVHLKGDPNSKIVFKFTHQQCPAWEKEGRSWFFLFPMTVEIRFDSEGKVNIASAKTPNGQFYTSYGRSDDIIFYQEYDFSCQILRMFYHPRILTFDRFSDNSNIVVNTDGRIFLFNTYRMFEDRSSFIFNTISTKRTLDKILGVGFFKRNWFYLKYITSD